MNSYVKNVLIFGAGALVGSAITYISVKKIFEYKADVEIEEVREAYNEKIKGIEPVKSSVEGEIVGEPEIDVKKKVQELNNKPDLKDYTKFFREKGERSVKATEIIRDRLEIEKEFEEGGEEDVLAENEYPDDEELSSEEDLMEQIEYENYMINKEHQDAIAENRAPYAIDRSDYELTCAHYDKLTFMYFINDDLLVNEDEEVVTRSSVFGDVIDVMESSDFINNDEECLLVRNDKHMIDFEILKMFEPYQNTGENISK